MRVALTVRWTLLGLMTAGGAVPVACGGETSTTYGPPDGLVGRPAPTPTGSTSASSTGTSTATTPPPPSDGGTAPSEGGTTTMGCTVSWATDVFPILSTACSGGTCHAGGGTTDPAIVATAAGTYNSLSQYNLLNGTGYITTGNTNSPIGCQLITGTCGTPMPMAPGAPLTAAQKTTITTWVACGVPNN